MRMPDRNNAAHPDDGRMRLNRYLAQCGLGSRRACDALIAGGKVYVNGARVTELGSRIAPGIDKVEFKRRELAAVREHEYAAYHKPPGVTVTAEDPHAETTIYDALAATGRDCGHLRYAGRLDKDSEGLLLLTNDGGMIHALTHPRFAVKKVYQALLDAPISREQADQLIRGVTSEEQLLRAGDVRRVADANGCWYEIDLYEGKKRQIRRMVEALGRRVVRLVRTRFGPVRLGDLQPGGLRQLTEREKAGLFAMGYAAGKAASRRHR
jgi:23S rRNA pseudouridine2605 synthase